MKALVTGRATPKLEDKVKADAKWEGPALIPQINTDVPGKLSIWRIENFKKVPLPQDEYGHFYSGDSYIVLFEPEVRGAYPCVYYWLGKHSTQDEKGAAGILTKDIVAGSGDKPTHCRVVQGKEPDHFLNLFKGEIVIKFGGVASGFKNVDEEDELVSDAAQLYHIKGTSATNTRAVQVPLKTSSLNSADAFVLNTADTQYIWYGKGCETVEREYSLKAAQFIWDGQDVMEVEEGEEPELFWAALGGKGPYSNAAELQSDVREPRLFHCSNASGVFDVEEMFNWSQEDLMMDDIFMLDTFNTVYIWIGPDSNETEKKKSFEMAVEYVKEASAHDGRDPDSTPISVTYAGFEPQMFTMWFQGWDSSLSGKDSYERALEGLKKELASASASDLKAKVTQGRVESLERDVRDAMKDFAETTQTFSYALLRRDLPGKVLPNNGRGIDTSKLEMYLHDDEFKKLFGCTKAQWEAGEVKEWKKRELKAQLKLY